MPFHNRSRTASSNGRNGNHSEGTTPALAPNGTLSRKESGKAKRSSLSSEVLAFMLAIAIIVVSLFHLESKNLGPATRIASEVRHWPTTAATTITDFDGMLPLEIPSSLVVHGSSAKYTPVEEVSRRKFFSTGKGSNAVASVLQEFNWTRVDDPAQAHLYLSFGGKGGPFLLEKFQRYSRIPHFSEAWETNDGFEQGFRRYARSLGKRGMWFIPLTYRVTEDPVDREEFLNLLEKGNGKGYPWVLKQVDLQSPQGVEMLPPHSKALANAVPRAMSTNETYVIQQYVCNELKWFCGQKFDLRMFWMVASVDPLIVLYADGYVRVGKGKDNHTSWSATGNDLNSHEKCRDDEDAPNEQLWQRIQEHYEQRIAFFQAQGIYDPVTHVKSQMKEALARAVAAFQEGILEKARDTLNIDNFFSFHGCDFILDDDLDVWLIELQPTPGFGVSKASRQDMWKRLVPSMVNIVEDVAMKQASDPQGNLLPLTTTGGLWELIYADGEIFQYHAYVRSADKTSCAPSAIT